MGAGLARRPKGTKLNPKVLPRCSVGVVDRILSGPFPYKRAVLNTNTSSFGDTLITSHGLK